MHELLLRGGSKSDTSRDGSGGNARSAFVRSGACACARPNTVFSRKRFYRNRARKKNDDGFRTCDPTQAQGAMSSPRSGPAKQNLQLAVGSQNLHMISCSPAATSAASSTPVKDAVLPQQDFARPDGCSYSGKSSHSLERAARFLSAARVAPAPRNTAPRSIATRRARSRAPAASVQGRRQHVVAVFARVETASEESERRFGEESVAREMRGVNLRGSASSRCLSRERRKSESDSRSRDERVSTKRVSRACDTRAPWSVRQRVSRRASRATPFQKTRAWIFWRGKRFASHVFPRWYKKRD